MLSNAGNWKVYVRGSHRTNDRGWKNLPAARLEGRPPAARRRVRAGFTLVRMAVSLAPGV
jgi:hypothetical protein